MYELEGKYFDWDKEKNLRNINKHGVSFKMAATSFLDTNCILRKDSRHSIDEDRFILLGINKIDNLLVVSHCRRDGGNIIRIISARKADESETRYYEGRNNLV